MGRKRTEFGTITDAEIRTRTERGESAETIATALGLQDQTRTIRRRQAELRGKAGPIPLAGPPAQPGGSGLASPPGRARTEVEDVPDEVPEGTPVEQLDRWIRRLEKMADAAEVAGNVAGVASLSAKMAAMSSLRHRVAPLPKADPNENPDFISLGEQVEKRLFTLIDDLFPAAGVP